MLRANSSLSLRIGANTFFGGGRDKLGDSEILGEPKLFSLGEERIVGSIVGGKEGMTGEWVVSPS